jgi:small-conductance mechanosensitive channel
MYKNLFVFLHLFQEGGSKLEALEMELKAKQKEEAEIVAAHKANHDSIVTEEKRKKHLEQSLRMVRRQLQCENAYPSLESNTV